MACRVNRDVNVNSHKQLLWLLSQQVRADRITCSKQVVATGWSRLTCQKCSFEQRDAEIKLRQRTIAKQ
eukprot:2802171-Amphidinium_carterae.1